MKSVEFSERLRKVVDAYNTRDSLQFTSEVVADFVDDLSELSFSRSCSISRRTSVSSATMGITYEEKAFYAILAKGRDDHGFPYAEEKCVPRSRQGDRKSS